MMMMMRRRRRRRRRIIIPLWRNNINSQLDATVIILLMIPISATCFGR